VKDCERGQACTFGGGSSYINKTAVVLGNRILSQENLNQSTERGCLESYSNHQPTGINSYTRTYQKRKGQGMQGALSLSMGNVTDTLHLAYVCKHERSWHNMASWLLYLQV
jgi:hypothetical protein